MLIEMLNDVSDDDTTTHEWTTSADVGQRLTASPVAAAYEREKTVFEEVSGSLARSPKKSRPGNVDDDSRTRSFYFRQEIGRTFLKIWDESNSNLNPHHKFQSFPP